MPYGKNEVPTPAKDMPTGAQAIYRAAFNSAAERSDDESRAHAIAMSAVKQKYKKNADDKWVAKDSRRAAANPDDATPEPEIIIIGDAPPETVAMFDMIELDDAAKVRITTDGYLQATPRVARTGIQVYRGIECGRPDMDTVRVYRPESAVFDTAAIKTLTHSPITLDHPPERVTPDNWRKYAIGESGEEVLRDGGSVRVPMMVRDAAAIASIQSGKNQLSVGYDCDLKWTPGVTDAGEPYDAIQTKIRANHTAVVTAARAGPAFRIGDERDPAREPPMTTMKTITVDGIECQMTDTAAALVQRTVGSMQATITRLQDAAKKRDEEDEEEEKATGDAIKAKDAEIATLKQQLKDAEVTPKMLDELVAERQGVIGFARAIVGDRLTVDGRTVADIRREVVKTKLGEVAKDWDDKQIAASFGTLTVGVKPVVDTAVRDMSAAFRGPGFVDGREKAYATRATADAEAWKKGPNGGATA